MTTPERLRALADWFEVHPDAPLPYSLAEGSKFFCGLSWDKDEAKQQLRSLGSFEKEYQDNDFHANVNVAGFTIVYYASRDNVCTKRVVGTREVPREVIPSHYTPEKIIEAHSEEVVEWDCRAILADEPEQVESADIPAAPLDTEDEEVPF